MSITKTGDERLVGVAHDLAEYRDDLRAEYREWCAEYDARIVRCLVCRTEVRADEAAAHCSADDVEYHVTHPLRAVHNEHHAGGVTDPSCYWCA